VLGYAVLTALPGRSVAVGGGIDLGSGVFAAVPPGRSETPIPHTTRERAGVRPAVQAPSYLAEAAVPALAKGRSSIAPP
jgi:hypothetical protein